MKILKNSYFIKKYDTQMYNFEKIFFEFFNQYYQIKKLDLLHEKISKKMLPRKLIKVNNDQKQSIYKLIYKIDKSYHLKKKQLPGKFINTYNNFLRYLAKNIFKESIVCQSKPTLRVMFPNNKAVGEFHRDRDYNHPVEEINIWMPVTNALNSNTIWIESEYEKKDFSPINIKSGEFLVFDSSLMHGNKVNKEKKTRISFDFRIIPYKIWKKTKSNIIQVSNDQRLKFQLGSYYKLIKI